MGFEKVGINTIFFRQDMQVTLFTNRTNLSTDRHSSWSGAEELKSIFDFNWFYIKSVFCEERIFNLVISLTLGLR